MEKRQDLLGLLVRLGTTLNEADDAIRLAEKVLRIRDKRGHFRPLEANCAQRRFEERRGRRNIILKARQMGITTWVAGQFFLRTALQNGTVSLLVAHNREAAESIFGIVRRMWDMLPKEIQEGPLRLRRATLGEMAFAETNSEFRVASAADLNAGRGLSVQNLQCSEVGRWPGDASGTLSGLLAALVPNGNLVLESTPNGAYGAFYEAWKAGVDTLPRRRTDAKLKVREVSEIDGHSLVRHFFPWWLEEGYVGNPIEPGQMTNDERLLTEMYELTPEQIGFRRSLEKSFGVLRSQEFVENAETCFRATGSCCFETEAIERRLAEVGEPSVRRRNGALLQWFPAIPGRHYVVAVDTAGGGADGDYAALQVIDILTGMQCAELQERIRPAELAVVSAELASEYGEALVAVERNNHGAAVLALLEIRPGIRLFQQAGQAGWLTSAVTKPEMIARMGTLLESSPERFLSRRLLVECRTFVVDGRGRAGAVCGAHDDLVMAMSIAQAVRAEVLEGNLSMHFAERNFALKTFFASVACN